MVLEFDKNILADAELKKTIMSELLEEYLSQRVDRNASDDKAILKQKINKTIEQATILIVNIRTMFAQQQSYAGLNNARAVNLALVPVEMIVNPGTEIKDEVANGTTGRKLRNVFSGDVWISNSPIDKEDTDTGGIAGGVAGQGAFKVTFYGLPKDACVQIATSSWGSSSSSGLVGMHIWNTENSDTIESDYVMDNTYSKSYISNKEYFLIPSSVPLTASQAEKACSCTGRNTCAITWKYH